MLLNSSCVPELLAMNLLIANLETPGSEIPPYWHEPIHRKTALCSAINSAKYHIYLYTNNAKEFLDKDILETLQKAHKRQVAIFVTVFGKHDPAHVTEPHSALWQELKNMVGKRYLATGSPTNGAHIVDTITEMVVADDFIRSQIGKRCCCVKNEDEAQKCIGFLEIRTQQARQRHNRMTLFAHQVEASYFPAHEMD